MFTKKRELRLTQPLAFSALLLLSACGGSNHPSDPTSQDPPPTPAPTQAPTPAPTPAPSDVVLDTKLTSLDQIDNESVWPDGSGTGQPIDGVNCSSSDDVHIHALVSFYQDGVRVGIPKNIGMQGCTYELYTLDQTGIINNKTGLNQTFTFGQFFAVWGKEITATSVAGLTGPIRYFVIENGTLTPFNGDPATIQIAPHRELLIIVGKSPGVVPNYQWPAGF
jgi:hypothetical protein